MVVETMVVAAADVVASKVAVVTKGAAAELVAAVSQPADVAAVATLTGGSTQGKSSDAGAKPTCRFARVRVRATAVAARAVAGIVANRLAAANAAVVANRLAELAVVRAASLAAVIGAA